VLSDEQLEALGDDLQLDWVRQTTFGQVNHYIGEPSDCRVFYAEPGQEQFQELLRFEASVQRADWADEVVQKRQDSGLPDAVNDGLVEAPAEGVLVGRLIDLANENARVWMDRVCPAALGDGVHEDYAAVQSMVWEFPVEELGDVLSPQEQDELLAQLEDHMDETMPARILSR